jgi:hypothetical protein
MPNQVSRKESTPREEWDVLARSVNAGFLRRWNLHDPSDPVFEERSGLRTSRQESLSRRPERASVR